VCAECGANYVGDGLRDYICPTYHAGPDSKCHNNLRFRREDAHIQVFDLLREELLCDAAIARGKRYVESVLKQRERDENAAAKDAESGVDVSRLDKEAAELRGMSLRPGALAAGLAEIEKERQELLTRAVGKRDRSEGRARQLLERMPEIVAGYRAQVQRALTLLAKPEVVEVAREATRRMLENGRITLAPNAQRTAVTGPVLLRGLGEQMVEMAGLQRHCCKPNGSGGPLRAL
jgi:hypothetical protein